MIDLTSTLIGYGLGFFSGSVLFFLIAKYIDSIHRSREELYTKRVSEYFNTHKNKGKERLEQDE